MDKYGKRHSIVFSMLAAFVAVASVAVAVRADEPSISPARARAAMEAGTIMPLARLLSFVEANYMGQVIDAQLHETKGRWTYEFEIIPANGRLFEIELDAASGAVVKTTGQVQVRP